MIVAAVALRETARSRFWPLLAASALAWLGIAAIGSKFDAMSGICAAGAGTLTQLGYGLQDAWLLGTWKAVALSMLLMLTAMMPPLLLRPVRHVWRRSFASRQVRAVLLFLVGYTLPWLLALMVLCLAAAVLKVALDGRPAVPFLVAMGIALAWQGCAAKRRLLNRCHVLPPLPAFGLTAEFASLRFGATVAFPCIGACWALMLTPMTAGGGHLALMAAVFLVTLHERYAAPKMARANAPLVLAGCALATAGALA